MRFAVTQLGLGLGLGSGSGSGLDYEFSEVCGYPIRVNPKGSKRVRCQSQGFILRIRSMFVEARCDIEIEIKIEINADDDNGGQ